LGQHAPGTTRLELLLAAVRRVETQRNKKLLDHFVERGFLDDSVLIAVMRKLNPDLSAVALATVDQNPMSESDAQEIKNELAARHFGPIAHGEREEPASFADDSAAPPMEEKIKESGVTH